MYVVVLNLRVQIPGGRVGPPPSVSNQSRGNLILNLKQIVGDVFELNKTESVLKTAFSRPLNTATQNSRVKLFFSFQNNRS